MTYLAGLPLLASLALADHPYYDYSADFTPVGDYGDRQLERAFDPQGPFVFGVTTSLSIPLPDIDSTLGLELPFSFEFGGTSSTGTGGRNGRQFEGRSLEHRGSLFEGLAKHIAQLPGVDSGRACLQRAICEVAATPDHEDGLFGEIVNVILNASASIGSEMGDLVSSDYKGYIEAESLGRNTGDCSSISKACKTSFFTFK